MECNILLFWKNSIYSFLVCAAMVQADLSKTDQDVDHYRQLHRSCDVLKLIGIKILTYTIFTDHNKPGVDGVELLAGKLFSSAPIFDDELLCWLNKNGKLICLNESK